MFSTGVFSVACVWPASVHGTMGVSDVPAVSAAATVDAAAAAAAFAAATAAGSAFAGSPAVMVAPTVAPTDTCEPAVPAPLAAPGAGAGDAMELLLSVCGAGLDVVAPSAAPGEELPLLP